MLIFGAFGYGVGYGLRNALAGWERERCIDGGRLYILVEREHIDQYRLHIVIMNAIRIHFAPALS